MITEKLEIKDNDLIIIRAPILEYSVAQITQLFNNLSTLYPNNQIIILPDDIAISTATESELISMRDSLNKIIENL